MLFMGRPPHPLAVLTAFRFTWWQRLALGWLVLLVLVAAVAPLLPLPYPPGLPDLANMAVPPFRAARHWLGTDPQGRDVLSILVYGARTAVLLTLPAALLAALVGGLAGAAAGFWENSARVPLAYWLVGIGSTWWVLQLPLPMLGLGLMLIGALLALLARSQNRPLLTWPLPVDALVVGTATALDTIPRLIVVVAVVASIGLKPQQLEYVIIPDVATAILALRRGDLDVFPQMPAREFERLRTAPATRAALHFYTTDSYNVVTAGFNTSHPALADAATRRALSRCFDAGRLMKATQLGGGQRTVGFISPSDTANYNRALSLIPFAPIQAAALLRQSGWRRTAAPTAGWFRPGPAGTRQQLHLTMRYRAGDPLLTTIALQFQAATAPLDIPVSLLPTEAGSFSEALRVGDFDMYAQVLKGNPFMFNFTSLLHSQGIGVGNFTRFSTPASDRLIEAIATASNNASRQRLLRQLQALMQQEMPLVPLFFLPSRTVADKRLSGLNVGSLKPGYLATTIVRAARVTPAP